MSCWEAAILFRLQEIIEQIERNLMKIMQKRQTTTRGAESQRVQIEFHAEQAQAMFIAGTFNDWHPNVTPMLALGGGRWAKELTLPPGRYEYRLVVDGEWLCDPAAKEQASNPYGGFNSVLVVSPKTALG